MFLRTQVITAGNLELPPMGCGKIMHIYKTLSSLMWGVACLAGRPYGSRDCYTSQPRQEMNLRSSRYGEQLDNQMHYILTT